MVLQPILILLGIAGVMPIIAVIARAAKADKIRDIVAIAAFAAAMYSLIQLYGIIVAEGAQKYVFAAFGPDRGGVEIYADVYSVYFGMIFCGVGLMAAIFSYRYMEIDTGLDRFPPVFPKRHECVRGDTHHLPEDKQVEEVS
jgi:NADH:ubiquinone oxidoreductase subunit 5 (subunit L)/multisubunit Na+/H+ antiporter MnhA subunit